MRIIDSHCHLESEAFDGRLPEVMAAAREAGVVRMVTASVEPATWGRSEAIAREHEGVAFALGVHPWFVKAGHEQALEELRSARDRGACAIGEIGLDKKIDEPAMDLQQRFFMRQAEIAREQELPFVVHCRGAWGELMHCLKELGEVPAGGVIHAFSGSEELVEQLNSYGFLYSMGRSLTYRNSKKRAAVLRAAYPERLLLETDSPDMPPVEKDGEVNVPANIRYCLAAAAEALGESEEDVAEATSRNAVRLFGLKL